MPSLMTRAIAVSRRVAFSVSLSLRSMASVVSGLRYINRQSKDFLSDRKLLRIQECLHQIAFSADNHSWEAFEPFLVRHFRLDIEPLGEQSKLICRNLAGTNPLEEMMQQRRRKILPPDFRHCSFAVGRRSRERCFLELSLPPQDRRSPSCAQRDSTILCRKVFFPRRVDRQIE